MSLLFAVVHIGSVNDKNMKSVFITRIAIMSIISFALLPVSYESWSVHELGDAGLFRYFWDRYFLAKLIATRYVRV